jgi:hypothetical protein
MIAAPGDVDWFRLGRAEGEPRRELTAETPALARVELTCPERVDLKLAIHDAAGSELWRVDEGGRRESEVAVNIPVRGPTYVRVFARPGDANPDEPYRLTWSLTADDGTIEHEPNGEPARPNPLPAGGSVQGTIHPRGDRDLYGFAAPADRPARVRATLRPVPKVNLLLSLHAAPDAGARLGAPLVEARSGSPEASRGRASSSIDADRVLEAPLEAGRSYLLQVRDATGKVSNPRDAYTLRVDIQ